MTEQEASKLAEEWIAAWNDHDLDRVLAHYSDDIVFTSPFVARLMGEGRNTVRGKAALRDYFRRALEAYPDLAFTLWSSHAGVDSAVLHYESVRGLRAAEFMRIDRAGRVCEVFAHYAAPLPPRG